MIPLVDVEEFLAQVPSSVPLPLNDDGATDTARIGSALSGATGVIVAYLPWLLDNETGEITRPIIPQFADALAAVCCDIALDRLTDAVTGNENVRNKYKESAVLLEKINREHQGGLEGPGLLESSVIVPSEEDGIEDGRFFKKGGVF